MLQNIGSGVIRVHRLTLELRVVLRVCLFGGLLSLAFGRMGWRYHGLRISSFTVFLYI